MCTDLFGILTHLPAVLKQSNPADGWPQPPCFKCVDLTVPSLHGTDELPCTVLTCQALAFYPEDNLTFIGFIDGTVRIQELWDNRFVRDLLSHLNGGKSIAVKDQNI